MGRAHRVWVDHGAYHVYSRGSRKEAIFRDRQDRRTFMQILDHVFCARGVLALSYSLLENHYHGVLRAPPGGLSMPMQLLNGGYSRMFGRRYASDAHVFRNRFGCVHIDNEEHLVWAIRYVERNPVEAGLCRDPAHWEWSSFGTIAEDRAGPSCLAVDRVRELFGGGLRGRRAFAEFVRAG
jgi:REP element-mobilizing transposase RayT